MSLTKTQIAFRRKWVSGLRSGEYIQITGRFFGDFANEVCAVGCGIISTGVHGLALAKVCGMSDDDFHDLIDMNEGRRCNEVADFLEIADTIELLTLADRASPTGARA